MCSTDRPLTMTLCVSGGGLTAAIALPTPCRDRGERSKGLPAVDDAAALRGSGIARVVVGAVAVDLAERAGRSRRVDHVPPHVRRCRRRPVGIADPLAGREVLDVREDDRT